MSNTDNGHDNSFYSINIGPYDIFTKSTSQSRNIYVYIFFFNKLQNKIFKAFCLLKTWKYIQVTP